MGLRASKLPGTHCGPSAPWPCPRHSGGLVEFVEDDEINGDGLQSHPGGHTPKVEEAVPDPLDVGRIGIPDPLAYGFRVVVDQGIDLPFGEVGHIGLIGEEVQDPR